MDDGLFTDDSPLRAMTGEALVLAGAGYAITLQIAHPGVGQGVHDHSDFTARPLDRLRGTLTFVYAVVFGTREEAEQVSRIVRAMHRKVNGPDYDALDPALQVWVAATLYHSAVRLYEEVLGPLPPADKERAHREAAILATALGCPESAWPSDPAAFREYWEKTLATIEVTDAARGIAASLFDPPNLLLKLPARIQGLLAAGLLPPHLREALGLPWSPRRQKRFDRLMAVVRAVYPRLPRAVRTAPKNVYLRDMRRRNATGRRLYGGPPKRTGLKRP